MVMWHNTLAMNADRQLKINKKRTSDRQETLSSGYRINRAADDAAGLSISETMRRQIRGLNRAAKNIQEGSDLCRAADGALTEVHAILQRLNELAVQSANGTNSTFDREAIQEEADHLITEIDRIAHNTKIFGTCPLLGNVNISKTSYSIPDNALHSLTGAEIYDAHGHIRFMVEGMKDGFAGISAQPSIMPTLAVRDANGNTTGSIRLTDNAYTTYTDYPDQNKFVFDYNDGTISYRMEQIWKIVDCSTETESREYYELSYNLINTSATEITFDFWLQMDILLGPKSNAIPDIDGVETPNTIKWTDSDIPAEMTLDNFLNLSGSGGTTLNVSSLYTWPGIENPPNIVMSGHRYAMEFDDAMDPSNIGDLGYQGDDYFYGTGWKGQTIPPGGRYTMQNRVGVYVEKTTDLIFYSEKNNPPLWIQSGCNAGDGIFLKLCNATPINLGIDGLSMMTEKASGNAIDAVADAIRKVSGFRSGFGAQQNRLEQAARIDQDTSENTQAAESRIRDADMAKEMMEYRMAEITAQAGMSVLAQANHLTERILDLLK